MTQFKKFLVMGTTAFLALSGGFFYTAASMSQDDLYEDFVTKPVEALYAMAGIKDEVKDKYKRFIESDKAFLFSMKIPDEILDIPVIYKSHTHVDKVFYPLMRFGQWLFHSDSDAVDIAESKYHGETSMYGTYKDGKGQVLNEFIMLGINALEKKDLSTYENLYNIFGRNQQKMTSFVFFHEFAHKVGSAMNNEENNQDILISIFEREKGVALSKEDIHIIRHQYSETFADSLALMMMTKKYPDIEWAHSRDMIAGLRLHDSDNGDKTHLTAPGLLHAKKPDINANLQEMIAASERNALVTAEYYSTMDFTHIKADSKTTQIHHQENNQKNSYKNKAVVFSDLDKREVRKNMDNAREKFISSGGKQHSLH